MRAAWALAVTVLVAAIGPAPTASAAQSGAPAALKPFLEDQCYECHDADVAKGGLDLTALPYGAEPGTHVKWVRVFDRVRAGEMPPAKKPRPAPAALRGFLAALETDLTAQHLAMRATVLRRLNRGEYRTTIEALLGQRVGAYEDLPEDALAHGFDTNGEALGLSDVHLRRYLAAADAVLEGMELRERAPQRATINREHGRHRRRQARHRGQLLAEAGRRRGGAVQRRRLPVDHRRHAQARQRGPLRRDHRRRGLAVRAAADRGAVARQLRQGGRRPPVRLLQARAGHPDAHPVHRLAAPGRHRPTAGRGPERRRRSSRRPGRTR